jgi:rhodanese-related sulfurtransferase
LIVGRRQNSKTKLFFSPALLCLRGMASEGGVLPWLSCDMLRFPGKWNPEGFMAHAPQFLKLVQDAKERVKETNVPDVKRRMDAGEKLILVDVREDNEWAKGHLPGAVHMGKGVIERDIEQQVPDTGTKLVLYCGGGFRSALVADNLQKMGYTNVESMDGGWRGWTEAGLPTVQ